MRAKVLLPILVVVLVLWTVQGLAGSLYSYINENGIRVYTNIGVNRTDLPDAETRPATGKIRNPYRPLITESARQFNLDAELLTAIIQIESHLLNVRLRVLRCGMGNWCCVTSTINRIRNFIIFKKII